MGKQCVERMLQILRENSLNEKPKYFPQITGGWAYFNAKVHNQKKGNKSELLIV